METKELYEVYKNNYLVDTDTRKIRKDTLFFALKGANFNGNTFAKKALNAGAKFAIIDEPAYAIAGRTIMVANVLKSLQKLAHYHRLQLNIPIIALTGSNGKTTTKELLHCVLSEKYNTTATKGNLNNHIGVPLTLLSMTPKTAIGIIEMGANHQKEIAFLCTITQPDFGYITNFGKAHLEGFGGIAGVIKGKSEIYEYLITNHKTAFINPDDKIQVEKTTNCNSISFEENAHFLEASPFVRLSYHATEIKTHLIGAYNYTNIIAAITIGSYFKVAPLAIKKALENYIPANNRSQIIKTTNNDIILDAYNANPSSMQVALENFHQLEAASKTVILGDMFELGTESFREHQNIVELTDQFAFTKIFYVGAHFFKCTTKNTQFKTFKELKNYLQKRPLKKQSIFIKGSRGMALERILETIQ